MMHALDQISDQSSDRPGLHPERRPFKDIKRAIIDDFERRYLHRLLEQHRFNLSAVGRSAGLSRKHICALIQKHGLYRSVLRARIDSLAQLMP